MRIIIFCFLVSFISTVLAQQPDTLSRFDSAKVKQDSLVKIIPIEHIGSIFGFTDSSKIIFDSEIPWIEYRSLSDIVWNQPHFYTRDLASIGQNNNLAFGGIDNRGAAVLIDGRSQADQYTNAQNVWLIPPDAIERIEIISGPAAFFYGENSSASVINIVTKNYYTNRPYTRLRYSQGVYNYTQTDVVFTQNVLRGFNITFGINHNGYGSNKSYYGRFANSNDDAWNIRTKLRYNFSSDLNILFSYNHTKTWTGLNGGVDIRNTSAADYYDGNKAKVYNLESYEKLNNAHYDFTVAVRPFGDSTHRTTLSAYASTMLREYRDEDNRYRITNGLFSQYNYNAELRGIKFQHSFLSKYFRLLAFTRYEEKQFSMYANADALTIGIKNDLLLLNFLSLSLYGAEIWQNNTNKISFGGDATVAILQSLNIFAGASHSYIPTSPAASMFPIKYSGSIARAAEEANTLQAGFQIFREKYFTVKLSALHQQIKNPLVIDTVALSNGSERQYYFPNSYSYNGISLTVKGAYGNFYVDGIANYLKQPRIQIGQRKILLFPEFYLDCSLYYHGMIAKNNLDLKIGVRGRYISKQNGMKPHDVYGVWIPYTTATIGNSGAIDAFAIGKIGDAYVHLIWENLLNSQYMLAPFYPMNSRNIRFGISWEFFD